MQTTYFANNVLLNDKWYRGQLIGVENGTICSIVGGTPDQADIILQGCTSPGFIDTQVNGGGGVLFNHQPSLTTLRKMRDAHAKYGTCAMLPSVISDDYQVMVDCANAVAEAIAIEEPGILGIHFEGPHLNPDKKGIHPACFIRPLSDQEMQLFSRQDLGLKIVTLAPEIVPPEQIRQLVKQGVIVAIGHTNASYRQTKDALAAGASGFTHLYNAMSSIRGREPGVVGAALLDKPSIAGLIVDHFHVHDENCILAIQSKGPDGIMLVTDSMSHVDAEDSLLVFNEQLITKVNGKLTTPDGVLAGSALDMMSAITNCHIGLDIPLIDAIKMATSTPAQFLKSSRSLGKIAPGYQANFVSFNQRFEVTQNIYRGKSLLAEMATPEINIAL
ncbi:N-acetylglucosamine-6-phosphate deacetylase [Glaciecola sp. 1036]|uniref:N-acetylglucosamine-6-phosphate deacetylase n=1 Tax=Alteromonadaceae TaxID=72275 RepID=UPI003D031B7A